MYVYICVHTSYSVHSLYMYKHNARYSIVHVPEVIIPGWSVQLWYSLVGILIIDWGSYICEVRPDVQCRSKVKGQISVYFHMDVYIGAKICIKVECDVNYKTVLLELSLLSFILHTCIWILKNSNLFKKSYFHYKSFNKASRLLFNILSNCALKISVSK